MATVDTDPRIALRDRVATVPAPLIATMTVPAERFTLLMPLTTSVTTRPMSDGTKQAGAHVSVAAGMPLTTAVEGGLAVSCMTTVRTVKTRTVTPLAVAAFSALR